MRRSADRRRALAVVAAGALVVSLASLVPAQAVDDPAIFELDGNAVDDSVPAGDDWGTVHAGTDNSLATTGILSDPAGQTIFTGGSTKDDLDITGWLHSTGSVPDKNEITNAYAAAYDDDGDLAVYFGLDKYSVNGNSNVGFWFLQQSIAEPLPASGFGISHEVGDVLVLSEFTNGGAVSAIAVYEWNPGPDAINGTLRLLASDSNANCTSSHNADACGVSNQGDTAIDSPWPYDPKSGPNDKFAKGAFFEGGVNLSNLFPGGTPCFSSFLAETRSSQSVDAVLKDFTYGNFPLCDAAIQISGSAVNEVDDDHTFTVDVQKLLGGSSSAADDGTIVDVDLTATNGASVNVIDDNCANPGTVDGTCTVVFDSSTAGVVTGHASTSVLVGDTSIAVQTDGAGTNSGDATKVFVDGRISIADDDTNGIGEPHTFTVDVEADDGSVNGFQPVTVGNVDVSFTDGGNAAHDLVEDSSTCDEAQPDGDNLDAAGQCTATINSPTAGTVTAHASATFDVWIDLDADTVRDANETVTLTRSTDGLSDNGSENSDDAVKTYVDGTLHWLKHDDQSTLLGGATFWVCRTHSYDSSDGSFDALTDTDAGEGKDNDSRCVVVADDEDATDDPDSNLDEDSDAGELLMTGLALGRYTVQEKSAPAGYQIDPDTVTVDLVIDDPATTADDESDGDAGTFVNPALFKVIVLTCNTTTEQLVVSEVDETPGADNEGVQDTLAAGSLTTEQQNAICALDGASYDDKTRGKHVYEVEIPKPTP